MAADFPELRAAGEALLSVCDGAHEQDGAGFNGFDAPFARDVLGKPSWSPRQASAVHKMLRKYKKQLSGFGIDYDALPIVAQVTATPSFGSSSGSQQVLVPHSPPTPQLHSQAPNVTLSLHEKYGQQFKVSFPYDSRVKDAFRSACKTTIWEPETKLWIVPGRFASELLEFARSQNWQFSDDALLEALRHKKFEVEQVKAREEATKASSATDSQFLADFRSKGGHALFPYQRAGAEYLVKKERSYLCDEPGLGKTVQALAAIHATKGTPALIIAPASVVMVWERHVADWLPGVSVTVAPQSPRAGSRTIHITSYDRASRNYESLMNIPWTTIILDEGHAVKNYQAKRTQRICGGTNRKTGETIPGIMHKARYRYILTGTPVPNRPVELLQPLIGLDRLKDLGGFSVFASRYCGWMQGVPGSIQGSKMENLPELNTRLRATCWVRRLKADVMKDLPPKFTDHIPMALSNMTEYRAAERDVFAFLDKPHSQAEELVKMTTLRGLAATGKVEAAIEWVENMIDAGDKLVLLGWHVEPLQAITAHFGIKAVSLMGGASKEERQQAIDRFQNDDSCLLFVGSKAAYEGITLTAASHLAFLELPWNPGMVDQASDRIHRIGQTAESVTYHYLLAAGTMDEYLADLIDSKRKVIAAIQDGKQVADFEMLSLLIKKMRGDG